MKVENAKIVAELPKIFTLNIRIWLPNCRIASFPPPRSTNTRGSNVESGIYQSCVLDPMERWAIREDAKFHIEGPKAPPN